jgi:type IV secretory pathway VirB4 component
MSAQHTCLNPQDVMFPTLVEQKAHTIRLYETLLGRQLSGTQKANQERALLGEALETLYSGFTDLMAVTPDIAPLTETVCDVLSGLGDKPHIQQIARDLSDEIAGLCIGKGPWAAFVNGPTNLDLSSRFKAQPQVFSFHEMEQDPIMLAIAYTQVLSAIRRDSLSDEQPRIIAVDEVYRLMRHPSLLDFLIEAAKTFRTRRKKLVVIDQQMSVFLEQKARLVFENCPIRVIFNQRQGLNVFHEDAAFQHFNAQHRDIIANLPRFHFLLDVQEEGIWYLYNRPSEGEFRRFRMT